MFPVEVEPDKGHASVQALPPNMEEGGAKGMMSTLTSATVNHALVSFHFKSNTCLSNANKFNIYHNRTVENCTSIPSAVHGNWGPWSSWGSCSRTCNGGQMRRYRTCDNPRPASGGRSCAGTDTEIQKCSTLSCPGKTITHALYHSISEKGGT